MKAEFKIIIGHTPAGLGFRHSLFCEGQNELKQMPQSFVQTMSTTITHIKNKKMLAPKLRFKEFNDEWQAKSMGELGDFIGGGTPTTNVEKYWGGNIPWISSSDLIEGDIHNINIHRFLTKEAVEESATKIIPKNSVLLISRVGVGKLAINKLEICTSQDFSNFIPIKCNSFYIGYFLTARKNLLINFSQGTSIKGFTTSDIKSLKIAIPNLPEQQKIAGFLSAVDEKMQLLNRKKQLLEQYKKGVMQQLFSGKLRFKNENGKAYPKWEEKKLGDVLDYIQPTKYLVESTEYDDSYETPVLTAGKTFILGYTNETKNIFKENLPVILFDDFTTATQFVDFPFKAKSSAMKILVPKKNENIRFIYAVMQLIKFEVGGHGRHWISQYALMNISYPSLEEQKKIADFLSAIDVKIESLSKQINQTQNFKKGLLQQMFV